MAIAAWLIAEGFRYTGADFSDAMLALARARWPEEDWRTADMRTLDLGEAFDGLIAWNSFFHLTQTEQRETLPRLAHHLAPHGTLMVTTGPTSGETTGTVANDVVFHASLSPAEYATLLEENGLTLTAFMAEDPHCQDHTVLIAKKTGD